MKKVSHYATAIAQRKDESQLAKKSASGPKLPPAGWVDLLFSRLEGIYGSRWAGQFGTSAALKAGREEWELGIADLSVEDLREALDWCRTESAWPPSIAEFRKAATASRRIPQAHRTHLPALPDKGADERSRAIGAAALKSLRESLA